MKRLMLCILVLTLASSVYAADKASSVRADFSISRVFARLPDATGLRANSIKVQKTIFASTQAPGYNQAPASALNTRTGQSLVVWQALTILSPPTASIQGRIVDPQGKAVSAPIKLSLGSYSNWPSVTFDPVSNEFALAYDDKAGISIRRISSTGRAIGKIFKIYGGYSRIAFNPKSGGYTLAFETDDGSLRGVQLTKTLTQYGPQVTIRSGADGLSFLSDVAYSSSGNKLFVTILDVIHVPGNQLGDTAVYLLATLDPALKNVTKSNIAKINSEPVNFRNGRENGWGISLALLPDQTGVVFYQDNVNVKGRKIAANGKLSGPSFPAFNSPKKTTLLSFPSVAFSTTSKGTRGLLIAIQDAITHLGTSTWAQVLNEHGRPTGAPVQVNVETPPVGGETVQGLATPLPGKSAESGFRFNWYATSKKLDSNSVIVKLNLVLATL